MQIALCVISKDNEGSIQQMLDSTEGIFDVYCLQDTGSTDKTVDIFTSWCEQRKKKFSISKKQLGNHYKYVTVNGNKILGDFGRARGHSFNLAKKHEADFVLWLDTDDILVNAQAVRPLVEHMQRDNTHVALLTYIYAQAEGNIKPVVQERERLLDLRVPARWKNRVHETYEFQEPARLIRVKEIQIEHRRTGEAVLNTGRRNSLIMHAQLKEEGLRSFSDSLLNSLAYDHWEHKEYRQAIKFFKLLLKRKTVAATELLYQVHLKIARAYIGLGNYDKAIVYANKVLFIDKARADGYLLLADIYTHQQNWLEAIHYADKVLSIGKPDTSTPINEMDYTVIPLRIKINAHLQLEQMEQARELTEELSKLMPNDQVRAEKAMLDGDLITKNAILGINNLMKYLQAHNKMNYADRVREAIPLTLMDHPTVRKIIDEMMHDFRHKTAKVKLKDQKSITFYAGGGVIEPWDGQSDVTRGIGGSEGMAIQLSRELAQLGNKVIVYNECGNSAGKIFNGVLYEDHRKWDPKLRCDIFVSLRDPAIFGRMMKARKQYLWLHDTHYGELPTSLFYTSNKVIVLSEAHKHIIKEQHGIQDDSIFWISRNGLNPISMEYADKNKGKRNPYQLFYASSYDRGLDNALKCWPKIKEAIPEATFKIIYGWNTFDKLMEGRLQAGDPHGQWMKKFKSEIIAMISQSEGVQELGRVSQNEHYKLAAESSMLFYPSPFYEISFIGGMVAQAQGAIPVTTPHAAMNETISTKYGMKVKLEQMAEAVIYSLKHSEEMERKRKPMMEWARKAYDMKVLAKEWDKEFSG